ncbi:hypothetical protein ABB37_06287 [Leptomonas pyrrhocoris]|uniref:Uncharacterized protein n=1 Tax=Leptomonas pyrrhocoris TaxID=157538 RepID=A0A0N0VED8_LEPPY|nr:hypothetical protein ABB37_06287 [Leptomonas pyrrhocoris]XP_015656532.1 hypothetical protein ABB37_06287 [Leptomonas pyrrhocoris]XP_015656533.1 hypothetical protein ABB37_06287 [Leptomonas pyrrhocoris]KPA78092.1 hypothetical protein ABB37_06287 [Leptomonas pyrrhocoris]KPA78093.1 hypothetical protein ABB37_06287 [Leptomonas pyrrhocoris]KPA78094.1 hypothetical protein ABB37_06287 [Leptomonas pyrrhocoris]|eukprot:XP_015656531.1 hypothetical protein ABB37_06287 [Leptomonas pyrrhocoris]
MLHSVETMAQGTFVLVHLCIYCASHRSRFLHCVICEEPSIKERRLERCFFLRNSTCLSKTNAGLQFLVCVPESRCQENQVRCVFDEVVNRLRITSVHDTCMLYELSVCCLEASSSVADVAF